MYFKLSQTASTFHCVTLQHSRRRERSTREDLVVGGSATTLPPDTQHLSQPPPAPINTGESAPPVNAAGSVGVSRHGLMGKGKQFFLPSPRPDFCFLRELSSRSNHAAKQMLFCSPHIRVFCHLVVNIRGTCPKNRDTHLQNLR